MAKYIRIDGVIDLMNNQMSHDQFWERFINWVEANGWTFTGFTDEFDEEELGEENECDC